MPTENINPNYFRSFSVVPPVKTMRSFQSAMTLSILISIIGTTIAYFESFGVSLDREQYNLFFDTLRMTGLSVVSAIRFEAGFTNLAYGLVSDTLDISNSAVYACFVLMCLFMKGFVIGKRSATYFIAFALIALYFSRYFPIHEYTQLRVSCAIAFLLLAFHFRHEKKIVASLVFSALGVQFHNSAYFAVALIYLPHVSRRYLFIAGIIVLLASYFFAESLIGFAINSIDSFSYLQKGDLSDHVVNLVNPNLLLEYSLLATAFYFWKFHTPIMKHVCLIQVTGLLILVGFMNYPVFAFRTQELFSTFWIFYFADGLKHNKTKWYCLLFIVANIVWHNFNFHYPSENPFFIH